MANINVKKQLQTILKEGFLDKQSRFLKTWRKRWFVLTPLSLMTFKERKQYNSPTEVIALKQIASIKSCDQQTHKEFSFVFFCDKQRIDTSEETFFIAATSNTQKQQWIGQIGKAMVKSNSK